MKFLTPLLCLLFVQGIAIAEEPAELTERRQAWEKSRSEAQANVDKLYFAELEELKKNFTKAGNIADAMAVDNAIKGGEKADNEPAALGKMRQARSKSLKKALTPLDKKYWQDLKKLKADYQGLGDLAGVVAADAEIEKVLAAHKKPHLQATVKRSSLKGLVYPLQEKARCYSNRDYTWGAIPKELNGYSYMQGVMRVPRDVNVDLLSPGILFCAFSSHKKLHEGNMNKLLADGWKKCDFMIGDDYIVLSKNSPTGETIIPWVHPHGGSLLIFKEAK